MRAISGKVYLNLMILTFLFVGGNSYADPFDFLKDLKFKKSNYANEFKFIKSIARSNKYIWVASSIGLLRIEIGSGREQKFLPEVFITAIAVDADEQSLWLGTPNGLIQFNTNGNRRVDYRKDNSKLSDNRINALLLDKNVLYIGNQFGVDKFQINNNVWTTYTAIEGLAGNNIQSLKKDSDYIWAGGADGISYYDENEDLWNSYGAAQGLNSSLVTDLVIDANIIWAGTAGGGLAKFDRNVERFEILNSEFAGLIDDSVQSLVDDGAFLWVNTFDGVSLLDKEKGRFINFHNKNGLSEPSIFCGEILGGKILLGTDSGGIYEADKRLIQLNFNLSRSGYENPGAIGFYADIQSDTPLKGWTLSYRELNGINAVWQNKGLEMQGVTAGFQKKIGSLSDVELKDGKYVVQLKVEDTKGGYNTVNGLFIVDKTKPDVKLFFRSPEPGEKVVKLSGRYTEDNLKSIKIFIGKTEIPPREIEIERLQKRFRFPYVVDKQEPIRVVIEDIAGNRAEEQKDFVVDRDPPKLEIRELSEKDIRGNTITISGTVEDKNMKVSEGVIINPGAIFATLNLLDENKYQFKVEVPIQKEGKVEFQITAFDLTDKSTTVKKEINFTAKEPSVFYDPNIITFSLRERFEIKGNLLGPNPDKFYLTPGDLPFRINPDKSFTATLLLNEGKNIFKAILIHRETNTRLEKEFTVEYSQAAVKASLQMPSRNFSQAKVVLRGSYDRGATKILFGKIDARLNSVNNTFEVEYNLNEGVNNIEMTVVDEIGRVAKSTEVLIFDKTAPVLYLRTLPARTGLRLLPVKGKVTDVSDFVLEGFPAVSFERMNSSSGEFEALVQLTQGSNRIIFEVEDKSGNKSKKEFKVIYHPDLPLIESDSTGNEELVFQLREEIRQLKELLNKKGDGGGGNYIPDYDGPVLTQLPLTSSLVLLPFHGRTKNYQSAAQYYLGNEKWATEIAGFNGLDPFNLSRILIPTPRLYTFISTSSSSTIARNLIQHSGRSYMNNQNPESVKRSVLQYLTRTRLLKGVQNLSATTQVYLLNNRMAVLVQGGGYSAAALQQLKKNFSVSEILVASVSASGLNFSRM